MRLPDSATRRLALLRDGAMGGMLLLTALGIFVLPVIVPPGSDVSWPNKVLLVLVLVSGIAAVSEHRRIAVLLTVLAVAVVVGHLLDRVLPTIVLAAWHDALLIAALVVLATAVGINVFGSRRSVADRLFGAIALYLLLGVIWASAYALVAATVPNAFTGAVPAHATMFEWGYFSLVTLTTVGYGDITPVANVARSLATLEALVGQLYPAIIIARLVSAQDASG